MAQMMRRMGIQNDDVPGVEEVVIRTATVTYRFTRPQVSRVRAQGSETWQVQGSPREEPTTPGVAPSRVAVEPAAPPKPAGPLPNNVPPPGPPSSYTPDPEDVKLVMQQTGASEAAARQALLETGGDLAEAIVKLGA